RIASVANGKVLEPPVLHLAHMNQLMRPKAGVVEGVLLRLKHYHVIQRDSRGVAIANGHLLQRQIAAPAYAITDPRHDVTAYEAFEIGPDSRRDGHDPRIERVVSGREDGV